MLSIPARRCLLQVPAILLVAAVFFSCADQPPRQPPAPAVKKTHPAALPDQNLLQYHLPGEWGEAEREYSGATFWKNSIVLMPQYPERCGNRIPVLSVDQLLSPGAGKVSPLPATIAFEDDGLSQAIPGFEGFEALAFRGDSVFVTVESHTPTNMLGYLVRGTFFSSGGSAGSIKLDANSRVELAARANLGNMTDEAIVILPDGKLLTFYEANGIHFAPQATAYLFDISGDTIKRLKDVPMIPIEYRVTDCTPADAAGKFWCINYMFPGDESKLKPAPDPIAEQWGISASQEAAWKAGNRVVERLIELQFDGSSVRPTETAPLYIPIREDGKPSNWEGIAHIAGKGFFVVTDKFPETRFAFVEAKGNH